MVDMLDLMQKALDEVNRRWAVKKKSGVRKRADTPVAPAPEEEKRASKKGKKR